MGRAAPAGQVLAEIPGRYACCRLGPGDPLPGWADPIAGAEFVAISRTGAELSIVCPEAVVPDNVRAERGMACLRVDAVLDHSLTGILASLAVPLAEAEVPIFAVSTYDTDYLLYPAARAEAARAALTAAGHSFR